LLVFEKNTLQGDGMMIIEHSKYTKLDHLIHFSFKKSYGGSIFSFFEIGKSNEEEIDDEKLFSESEEE
jgi:16S rRNA (guanine966-N2)-methyltransferase